MVVCGLGGYGYQEIPQDQKAARQLTLYGNVDVREVAVAFRQSDRIAEELVEEGDKGDQRARYWPGWTPTN